MNRKQFRSLLGEMSNLVEQANREESVLQESKVGESISNRARALKDLTKPQTESVKKPARALKQEETYSDEYKPLQGTDGMASKMSKGPKSSGEDSSKPRVVPTASLSGQSKTLPQGLKTKVQNKAGMDALDMNKRSGKIAPEEPEADGAEYGLVDEPDEYTEAMDRLRTDWKRLMGESSWTCQPTVTNPKKKVIKEASDYESFEAPAPRKGPPPPPRASVATHRAINSPVKQTNLRTVNAQGHATVAKDPNDNASNLMRGLAHEEMDEEEMDEGFGAAHTTGRLNLRTAKQPVPSFPAPEAYHPEPSSQSKPDPLDLASHRMAARKAGQAKITQMSGSLAKKSSNPEMKNLVQRHAYKES